MLSNDQFRTSIIRPVLAKLNLYSRDAEELLVATMAHESQGGTYLVQASGPALGVYQMEPYTHDSIWNHNLSSNPELARAILNGCRFLQKPEASELVWNLQYATMMARIYYRQVRDPLPAFDDIDGIWNYYKEYWNTTSGSAKKDDFLANYNRFIGKQASKKSAVAV